jgi:hypothetical protein
MNSRRTWVALGGFLALGALAAVLSAYSGASSSQRFSPEQPVRFPHPVHVQGLQMNCLYCHSSATKSPDPGIPAVGTCMGCHTLVGPDRPATAGRPAFRSAEIEKLQRFAADSAPIPWVRIHKLPEYVQFPHMRHVGAGVSCQTCHGDVQNMQQVYQAQSLSMGWCVSCHVGQSNPPLRARYDCAVCHY